MADKKMSEMAVDSSLDGTERLLAQGADGSVILVSAISAYVIDDLIDSTAATPTTGDYLLGFRGTDEKKMTLDNVAAYVGTYTWSTATTVTPAVSGDLLLVSRSGTIYDMDVDTLKTYALVGVQATVLNTSSLGSATLGSTDLFPVCQVGSPTVPKTVALSALETTLWADFKTYVTGLTAVASSQDSDIYYVVQGGGAKYVTGETLSFNMSDRIIAIGDVSADTLGNVGAWLTALTEITAPAAADEVLLVRGGTSYKATMTTVANYAIDATVERPWQEIAASKYTALPASTSTLTMSDTTDLSIGDPVKFTWSGVTYYAIVSAILPNAQITISGAPFSASVSLTSLSVGQQSQVVTRTYFLDFVFGDAVDNLLASVGRFDRWEGAPAFLVAFAATQGTVDTGASQPKINVAIDGSVVSTDDSSKGLQLSGTGGTWVANTAVQISPTTYDIVRGNAIEIRCTEAGSNGDASMLSINLTFVYE